MFSYKTKKTKVAVCSIDRSDSINDTRTSDLKVTFNGTDYALHRMMVEAGSKYFSSDLKVTSNRTDYALHRVMVEAASKYFSSALKVTFNRDVYELYRMKVEASSKYFSSALKVTFIGVVYRMMVEASSKYFSSALKVAFIGVVYRMMVKASSKYFSSALKVAFIGVVYRMMVEASSKYFSSALSDFKESASKHIIIDLDFVSQDDFLFVMQLMYGAQVDVALDVKQLENIYRLVCYLQAEEIRNLLLDLIKNMVTTGRQILDLNITCRSLLNDISEHVSHQIEDSDVCRLLRLSRETHSELLIKVCHEKLEEGGCLSKNNSSSFKEFTAEDVCVLFSTRVVPSLSCEDELLSLMQEVCIEASLTDDEQKEVARNVMIQQLSREGVSKAIMWDAIDNKELSSCLAGEHIMSRRRFGKKAPIVTRPVDANRRQIHREKESS